MDIRDRVKGALFGAMIGDALAAPTHWFYGGIRQVVQYYGRNGIVGYTEPVDKIAGSIMSKSNTGGAGRGSFKGDLIGTHIFHGKKKYWRPGSNYFYHNLLKAGDNTLETLLMVKFADFMSREGGNFTSTATKEKLIDEYIDFLTTKDSHRDTYCGTSHRMFFQNLIFRKKDKLKCADNDAHNVDAIDALVCLTPLCLFYSSLETGKQNIDEFSALFRDSRRIPPYAALYQSLLRSVVFDGKEVSSAANDISEKSLRRRLTAELKQSSPMRDLTRNNFNLNAVASDPDELVACYIDSNFSAMLNMLYKYGKNLTGDVLTGAMKGEMFRNCLLANANRGGENVNSGSVIGAVMGGFVGFSNLPEDLVQGLHRAFPQEKVEFEKMVDTFVEQVSLNNKL